MKYEIKGKPLPVAILHLDQGESILTDSGAMVWMKPALTIGYCIRWYEIFIWPCFFRRNTFLE
jgi:uncharacterized protein (AIM24 family)